MENVVNDRLTESGGYAMKTRNVESMTENLTQWVEGFTLVGMVLEAVNEIPLPMPERNFQYRGGSYRPQMLLTLLSYSYATGLYGSMDISSMVSQEKTLKYICAGNEPEWQTLRQFRRNYHQELQEVLIVVMQRVREMKFPKVNKTSGNDSGYLGNALSRWNSKSMVFDAVTEAKRRLQLAIAADSIAMDE